MNIKIDKITQLRKSKGLTITRLAKLLDVTTRTVYNWESGRSYPSKAELTTIAHLLNVRLCEISDFKDLPLFYTKPSLQSRSSAGTNISSQMETILQQYKSLPDFNPYPIIKAINENIRLSNENKRLDVSLRRHKSILDSLSSIIYTTDARRTIRYYNKYFLYIAPDSFKEENIIGSKLSDIFSGREIENIIKIENNVFQNGLPITDKEVNIAFLDDKQKYLISIIPLLENENIVYEILVSIKNVSFLS